MSRSNVAAAALATTVLASADALRADVLHVPADHPTITAAILASQPGDEIVVAPGVYTNPGFPIWSSTHTGGHALTVRSSDGPGVTILDGLNAGRLVELFDGEGSDTVLEGFTLRNGAFPTNWGGAALFLGASPTIIDCVFEDNAADYGGGAANYDNANTTYIGCVFRNNTGVHGAGVNSFRSNTTFTDCVFEGNVADDPAVFTEGGGAAHRLSVTTYTRCSFVGNFSDDEGGGLHVRNDSDVTLIDCLVVDNAADNSGGGGVRSALDSRFTAINSRFLGNASGQWGGGVMASFVLSTTLTNCEFSGNVSGTSLPRVGGAVYTQNNAEFLEIVNCTISENQTASNLGGGLFSSSDVDVRIANTVFWGNTGLSGASRDENDQLTVSVPGAVDVRHCVIDQYAATPGVALTGADPLLVDPLGPDTVAGTLDDDLRLNAGSPAIDAGDNNAIPPDVFDLDGDSDTTEGTPYDISGGTRRVDDPDAPDTGAGDAPIVDIGAHEALSGVKPCPGDFNGDGAVDFTDFSIVLGGYGDDYDFADFSTVLAAYGTTCD